MRVDPIVSISVELMVQRVGRIQQVDEDLTVSLYRKRAYSAESLLRYAFKTSRRNVRCANLPAALHMNKASGIELSQVV